MGLLQKFPKYLSYQKAKMTPTVLLQQYPVPSLANDEVYYPKNEILSKYFTSEKELQKFGAAQFCNFLGDTIEVEHCLVIPAIASLRRIPYRLPDQVIHDLFKTATDEGFHAEQAVVYLSALENFFLLAEFPGAPPPLFLRKLEALKAREDILLNKYLMSIMNGIVTETRISIELGHFAHNYQLSTTVRAICGSHAKDEAIHASQFKALAKWLWQIFDDETKQKAAEYFFNSAISRSIPDIESLINSFVKATGREDKDARHIVLAEYNEDLLIHEMQIAARPTFAFLSELGIDDVASAGDFIENERKKLRLEIKGNL